MACRCLCDRRARRGGVARGGAAVALSVHTRERQAFQTSAADVSGTLKRSCAAIPTSCAQVRAVLTEQPDLSARGFQRSGWRCSKKNVNSRQATAR